MIDWCIPDFKTFVTLKKNPCRWKYKLACMNTQIQQLHQITEPRCSMHQQNLKIQKYILYNMYKLLKIKFMQHSKYVVTSRHFKFNLQVGGFSNLISREKAHPITHFMQIDK